MNNNTKLLLMLGVLLACWGLFSDKIKSVLDNNQPAQVDVLELAEPTDPILKKEATDIINVIKSSGVSSKSELRKLRDLMTDLATLIYLDGGEEVVKTTEEIRQANSLSGVMLRLDIKGKYASLAKESKDVIVTAIGDDNLPLSKELRLKAVEGFNALAWAYNESTK